MPIEIQKTEDGKGIIFSAVDDVNGKDIIKGITEILNDNSFADLKYWISERSRCTKYDVSSKEVQEIANLNNQAAKNNPNLLVALIAETDLQFGMSRMYEAYIDEHGFQTMVFRSREEADKWLNEKLHKT